MADLLTKCPKCGQNLSTRGPKFDAEKDLLYTLCECGFTTNFRHCLDYKAPEPKPQPKPEPPKPAPKPEPKAEPKRDGK